MSARLLYAEARLDNRAFLIRELGADRNDVTDADLVRMAHARWGDGSPERLEGDFAFAIVEERSGRILAARDRLGAKPLCYRASTDGIDFGSDAWALASAGGPPVELDDSRIADALVPALEGADATRTFFRDVKRLPPGHRLTFETGRLRVEAYWSLDPSREIRYRSDAEYVDAFREVFSEAVRCRLTGDAGSMLSGGLDSSAIVGFGRRLRLDANGAPLPTLSAVRDDALCEESRHILAVAALPGLAPRTVRPQDLPAFDAEIDAFFAGPAEPFDTAMIVPLLMYAAARRAGLRAVLDGVDGDVVASLEPDLLESLLIVGEWKAAVEEARGLGRFYRHTYRPWSSPPRLLLAAGARALAPAPLRSRWRELRRGPRVRDALAGSPIRPEFAAREGVEDRLRAVWARPSTRNIRERQIAAVVHPQIVAAVERYHRVAASQGVEARHPFLDPRVVEFCVALPWEKKVRGGWSKVLVRQACEGILPDDVRWRPGRWVRLGPWFLSTLIARKKEVLFRTLDGAAGALEPFVDPGVLRQVTERYRATGDPRAGETLWHVAHLASWVQRARELRYNPGRVTAMKGVR